MASPQKEDGYTAIANAIIEKLACQVISPDEWRVLCVILRKTYGWRKAEDWISLSQFVEMSGMKKQHVCRAIKKLLSRQIITQTGNAFTQTGNAFTQTGNAFTQTGNAFTQTGNVQGWKYGLQKDFDLWITPPRAPRSLPKQVTIVTQIGNQPLPKQGPTKATITKAKKTNILLDPETNLPGFAEFWGTYPRKIDKSQAAKTYQARIKDGADPEDLLKAAQNYAAHCLANKTEAKFIKHPKTFLNPDWRQWLEKETERALTLSERIEKEGLWY